MLKIIIFALLAISIIAWISCIVIAIVGGCSIESYHNPEEWNNKKCEKLYYKIFAPVAVSSMICCIVLQFINLILK